MPGEHLRHPVSQAGGPAPSNQTSQFGRRASRTLSPCVSALMSRLAHNLSSRAHRARPSTSSPTGSTQSDRPRVWRWRHLSACSSSGGDPASAAAAAAEMVRKPLTTLMATVLYNLLTFRRLQWLVIKSSAQMGAP